MAVELMGIKIPRNEKNVFREGGWGLGWGRAIPRKSKITQKNISTRFIEEKN